MKNIVLIAAAPLALTACGLDTAGNNSTAFAAPGAQPDEITVNGVTYVRADKKTVPAPTPTSAVNTLFGSSSTSGSTSSTTSDSGSSVPPNTDSGSSVAADHGE